MDILEIVLLVAGVIIFILSFLLPAGEDKKSPEELEKSAQEEIHRLVARELDAVKGHVDEVIDEAVGYAVEKTERSLERLSNEKIMAVNEYSDTVLEEIHRNHEEAMFLYDMLNDKHTNLKNTVSEVNRTVKEAEETVSSFHKLAPEAVSVPGQPAQEAGAVPRGTVQEAGAVPRGTAQEAEDVSRGTAQAAAAGETVRGQNGAQADGSAEGPGRPGRNRNETILALYRQGKSKVEIAKSLNMGVGEVKLVIDLFQNLQREEEAK